ncbi:hypothetical protein RRG08_022424 [Elysia crispata]|uniref:Uncharacterized protein n=1 Tax=Elysia crispata TaxID=231223 RepID=A0AAE0Z1G7_9GAST|nr:hypothetical protein RRG08_022424 [Elysia crispata]
MAPEVNVFYASTRSRHFLSAAGDGILMQDFPLSRSHQFSIVTILTPVESLLSEASGDKALGTVSRWRTFLPFSRRFVSLGLR